MPKQFRIQLHKLRALFSEENRENLKSIALIAAFLLLLGVCTLPILGALIANRPSQAYVTASHTVTCTARSDGPAWTITFRFAESDGRFGATLTERRLYITDDQGTHWEEANGFSRIDIRVPAGEAASQENVFTLVSNKTKVFREGTFTAQFKGIGDDDLPITVRDSGSFGDCVQ